jgi:hypothetical protein
MLGTQTATRLKLRPVCKNLDVEVTSRLALWQSLHALGTLLEERKTVYYAHDSGAGFDMKIAGKRFSAFIQAASSTKSASGLPRSAASSTATGAEFGRRLT